MSGLVVSDAEFLVLLHDAAFLFQAGTGAFDRFVEGILSQVAASPDRSRMVTIETPPSSEFVRVI